MIQYLENLFTIQGFIENLVYPIAVVFAGSWIALFIDDKVKSRNLFLTVVEGLRRELRFAEQIHPLNQNAAQHLTGAFVYYPTTMVQRLLFDSDLINKVTEPFLSTLQEYLNEALLHNSLIENGKLVLSAGLNPGGGGAAEPVTIQLRKKLVENSKMGQLIIEVQKNMPRIRKWRKLSRSKKDNKQDNTTSNSF